VYLGVHPTLRVPVALKPAGSADRDRLRVEARLQAAVTHPNVVRVWDYEDGDDPVLVLEYVGGENLRDRLAHGPLAPRDAFTLTVQAALALRAAWRAGVTHGDVKPANVLLTPEDGFKLGDFGLARCRRKFLRSVPADAPRPGPAAAGTLNYMAPEQFEAAHDHRSDVYSLGLTLHHALTGCVPVPGTDPDEVMLRHKRGEVEPVHRVAPGVRREVSDLVRRMTAVDPARRFDTHDDLIRAAEAAFGMRLDLY
jgi:serine/threonine-protein kinase